MIPACLAACCWANLFSAARARYKQRKVTLMSIRFPAPIQWVLNYVWRGERNDSDSFYVISRYYSNPDTRAVYPIGTSALVLSIPKFSSFLVFRLSLTFPIKYVLCISWLVVEIIKGRCFLLCNCEKYIFNHPPRVSHDLNPLTPKIWLSILPSDCYRFPYELVMRI